MPPAGITATSGSAGANNELAAAPIVIAATGTTSTDNLLNDWQYGDNVSGFNPLTASAAGDSSSYTNAHLWGLAIQAFDRNTNNSQGYRYVKIDGVAPTIPNIATGAYRDWAEGEVLINHSALSSNAATASQQYAFLNGFASALGGAAAAYQVDYDTTGASSGVLTQASTYGGATGLFATPLSDPNTAVAVPVAIGQQYTSANPPAVPYTYQVNSNSDLGITPWAYDNTGNGNPTVQLQ